MVIVFFLATILTLSLALSSVPIADASENIQDFEEGDTITFNYPDGSSQHLSGDLTITEEDPICKEFDCPEYGIFISTGSGKGKVTDDYGNEMIIGENSKLVLDKIAGEWKHLKGWIKLKLAQRTAVPCRPWRNQHQRRHGRRRQRLGV